MADNAVDIAFPAPGSTNNIILVSGTYSNLIDRAIRSFKQLVSCHPNFRYAIAI
jgi:hypothetical protein